MSTGQQAGAGSAAARPPAGTAGTPVDGFDGPCALCGEHGRFVKDQRPTRESYVCASCRGSLRYQGHAQVIIKQFSRRGANSFAELALEPEFRALNIWEPGEIGPFRRYLQNLPHYERSSYWPDAQPGESRNGLRCEDLMATSFASATFDLIITSDILEHVRKPYVGFQEIHRILRPGGAHVFSIPVMSPMRATTVERVDTSGAEDVFLLPPMYHKTHLVYNDFGRDFLGHLDAIGFRTEVVPFQSTSQNAARLLTFCSVKPAPPRPKATALELVRRKSRTLYDRLRQRDTQTRSAILRSGPFGPEVGLSARPSLMLARAGCSS